MTERVLICGGGIGGLTAALSLLRLGLEVRVFERAGEIGEVGAGLQLSPNVMHVLRALGVEDALRMVAFEPQAIEMRDGRSGAIIFRVPMAQEAQLRYGAPYFHVHRADLIHVLETAVRHLQPDGIATGRTAAATEQDDQGVRLHFADGPSERGAALIGADGIHSIVREAMLGPDAARFTGHVAWRATVPGNDRLRELVPPTACVWTGAGRHAVTYWLRQGTLVNIVGVVERTGWTRESWVEPGEPSAMATDFENFAAPVRAVIDGVRTCSRWALFDRPPLARWSDRRITLLGDACHPTLPFLAQGAGMAIEGGFVLARCVEAKGRDWSTAFQTYEALRRGRTTRIQATSRSNATLYHRAGLGGWLTTYGPLTLLDRLLPGVVRGQLDWLYGYDATAPSVLTMRASTP